MVERARRGDREAFAELVRLSHARLIAAIRALVHDADAAEDISQDAFVDAWRQLPTLRRPERFRAWLFGIARHKALNHLRRARREAPLPVPESVQPANVGPANEGVRKRLEQLGERDREVLAAKYLQELSYAEIAQALAIPVNAVRVRCCRARQRLRELLSESDSAVEGEASA